MSDIKKIVFAEEGGGGFDSALKVARAWFDANRADIKFVSGAYGVKMDEDAQKEGLEEYQKTLTIYYTGELKKPHPQECTHPIDKIIAVVTKQPTCMTEGLRIFKCTVCGKITSEEIIPALDHEFEWTYDENATCLGAGTESGKCTKCGHSIRRVKPNTALGHAYVLTDENALSCTHDATEVTVCTRCGDRKVKTFPATALGHDFIWSYNHDATCITDGTETGVCTRCGEILTRTKLGSKLGHNVVWTDDNNATCTDDGTETGTCTRCGRTVTQPKPGTALGHDVQWTYNNDATCTEDGTETGACSRCNRTVTQQKVGTKLGHAWAAWVVDVQPTYSTTGSRHRTCSRCGEIETEELPVMIMDLNITTTNLNSTIVNSNYSAQLQTNAPVGSPLVWSLASGSLPPGISLNANGAINGKATSSGIYTFTVKVTCYSNTATKQYSINVAAGTYKVTFNANGGSCSESTRTVAQGAMIGTLPTPTRSGQVFGGWYTAATGGLKVDPNYSVSSNVTLYARWGESSDIQFSDATTQFNIQYEGDRTNYANNPYTLYHRVANGAAGTSDLTLQTGIASSDKTNTANMTSTNKNITLYLKVTNNGDAGNFDIGFDCDSYVAGSDTVPVTRIANGVQLGSGPYYKVTVPYSHTAWVGQYSERTNNRYNNSAVNTSSGSVDSGYAFTINNIFINSGSYVILEVTFAKQ